jgi:hypothetical protein
MIDWKDMAMKRAKKVGENPKIYKCSETKKELYFKIKDSIFPFNSFGKCPDCKKDFHFSALKVSEGISPNEWPVHYAGYSCKNCYYKDEIKEPVFKNIDLEPE